MKIVYTGTMAQNRVPYNFIKAVKKLVYEHDKEIIVYLVGNICDDLIEATIKEDVSDIFYFRSYVPHKESIEILKSADALLLVINNVPNGEHILTGKLFEYMGVKKPIFTIGKPNGDAAKLLKETNSGVIVGHDEDAFEPLKKLYEDWESGNLKFTYKSEKYSRRNLTKQLADVFNKTMEG